MLKSVSKQNRGCDFVSLVANKNRLKSVKGKILALLIHTSASFREKVE